MPTEHIPLATTCSQVDAESATFGRAVVHVIVAEGTTPPSLLLHLGDRAQVARASAPPRRAHRFVQRCLAPLRPLPWLLLVGIGHHAASSSPPPAQEPGSSPSAAVARLGTQNGLTIAQVEWIDPVPRGVSALWQRPRVLVVAQREGQLDDVFQGFGRFGPGGELLAIPRFYNLSRTPAAREHDLTASGLRAGWLVSAEHEVVRAETITLEPRDEPWRSTLRQLRCRWLGVQRLEGPCLDQQRLGSSDETAEWTWLQRWQERFQNWRELGSVHAIRRATIDVRPHATRPRLSWSKGSLQLQADGRSLQPGETMPRARPGNLPTWLAEMLRESPLGEQGVAILKTIGFASRDYARRAGSALLPRETELDAFEDLDELLRRRTEPRRVDGRPGWPPEPLTPLLQPPARNEGVWISLDEDPYVARDPSGRSPFVFSFLRPDGKRPYVRAYVLLWDPRRVALHAVAGAQEPRSTQGDRGSGRIPRDPKILRRVVGAFNGGFRTRHGEFGMGVDDTVYLPPKPYAATVATLADGSTALGTWPDSPGLPPKMTSYRQNLTALIQDGKPNPYRRHYWGGTPDGWKHESLTVRTALCLTREGYLAYVYGDFLDPDALIRVGQSLRCDYAMHLDMNAGHTGFELYRIDRAGILQLPEKPNESWQARGLVPDAPEFEFVARRLTRHMPLMNFPRYIHREQRDFFYLTLRPEVGERALPERWLPSGPQRGWHLGPLGPSGAPASWAHSTIRPFPNRPDVRARLLALDPHRLRLSTPSASADSSPSALPDKTDSTVATTVRPTSAADDDLWLARLGSFALAEETNAALSLWWSEHQFALLPAPPRAPAMRVAHLEPATDHEEAVALIGIDEDGFLLYVELDQQTTTTSQAFTTVSDELALTQALPLKRRLVWHLDRSSRQPSSARGTHQVDLWSDEGPAGRRLFPDTPIVEPNVWAYRQLEALPLE